MCLPIVPSPSIFKLLRHQARPDLFATAKLPGTWRAHVVTSFGHSLDTTGHGTHSTRRSRERVTERVTREFSNYTPERTAFYSMSNSVAVQSAYSGGNDLRSKSPPKPAGRQDATSATCSPQKPNPKARMASGAAKNRTTKCRKHPRMTDEERRIRHRQVQREFMKRKQSMVMNMRELLRSLELRYSMLRAEQECASLRQQNQELHARIKSSQVPWEWHTTCTDEPRPRERQLPHQSEPILSVPLHDAPSCVAGRKRSDSTDAFSSFPWDDVYNDVSEDPLVPVVVWNATCDHSTPTPQRLQHARV